LTDSLRYLDNFLIDESIFQFRTLEARFVIVFDLERAADLSIEEREE